jgi:hypothetical protein
VVDEQMTVSALRKALKPPKPSDEKSFHVTVPLLVWEVLKNVADDERRRVQAVAAEILVDYASSDEGTIKGDIARKWVGERRRKRRQEVGRRVARSYNPLRLEM